MKVTTFENIDHIHSCFHKYNKKKTILFRGQSDSNWKLIPKCGREEFSAIDDSTYFYHWKRRAKAFLDKEIFTDLELLTIAQHTGLATRLLDWTLNPLVALFFASDSNNDKDGAVFCYTTEENDLDRNIIDPFKVTNKFSVIQPTTPINRVANQHSYFTLQKSPKETVESLLDKKKLEKLIIPKELKTETLNMLNQYGINNLSIYPDLEGLSKHLNWFFSVK